MLVYGGYEGGFWTGMRSGWVNRWLIRGMGGEGG